jgi:hypothetical protein
MFRQVRTEADEIAPIPACCKPSATSSGFCSLPGQLQQFGKPGALPGFGHLISTNPELPTNPSGEAPARSIVGWIHNPTSSTPKTLSRPHTLIWQAVLSRCQTAYGRLCNPNLAVCRSGFQQLVVPGSLGNPAVSGFINTAEIMLAVTFPALSRRTIPAFPEPHQ